MRIHPFYGIMLYDRNKQFALLVLLFIVAPGVHFFLGGLNHEVPISRSYLVGAQVILGLVLTLFLLRKKREGEKTN